MARRLRGLFVAAVLLAALLPAAQGQDWAEMAYYQVIMQTGDTVYAYAYTGLAYPEPYLPCPLPYYIFEDCWDQYSSHAEADLYRDGWWVTGSQDWQFNGEAYAWVWAPAEGGWWTLASWHELDVQWEDWFDWWSWVNRYDYLYDYLLGYIQVSDPPPVVSSLVPSAAVRGESGQVTIYGDHFGQNPWVEVGGTGVTMQVTSVGQGWIQAQYWVESNAESGDHAVTVTTASGTSNPAAFTVQDPTPVVSWIDPDVWEASWSNVPVTIHGSGFGDNPVVNAGSWAAVSVQWANGVEIHGTVSVDPNAPDTMETVTVTSRGWGGQGWMPAPGANPTANATVQIRGAGPHISVTLSPESLALSTGDTNRYITTAVSPSATPFTVVYSSALTPYQPLGGHCNASLTIPQGSGTGRVDSQVRASPQGCSGVFEVFAAAAGVTSQNWVEVTVPPQILVQLLHGEAGGQTGEGDMSQVSVGVVARQRFYDPDFGNHSTYYGVITAPNQFAPNLNLSSGPDLVLGNAAKVYTNHPSTIGIVEDAKCFWSPTVAQWNVVQAALQSQTTQFPQGTGAPDCWATQPRQILYKTSIGPNTNPPPQQGAPAFLFLRKRSPAEPAVRQIP